MNNYQETIHQTQQVFAKYHKAPASEQLADDYWLLHKWLNEEQLQPVNRPALARVLWYIQQNLPNDHPT